MPQYDGSIVINTQIDTSGMQPATNGIKSTFSKIAELASNLSGVIAGAFSVRAIVSFGKEAMDLGSDLQEVQNVVDVTFTTMNEKVNEFAENAARTAGLSETMAKQYTGTFGAMADAFGFTEDEAFDMATALTQLSGDVASFYNLSQDEAYTKLKSVFTGETESLKDLGVVMTQTALDSYALANGFGKVTSDMDEQEKVALRYQFVMDQLSNASGDFMRTQDSWANQTKVLALQFDSLKASIGEGLIAVLTPAIQKVNEFVPVILEMADKFSEATKALFSGGDAGGLKEAFDQVVAAMRPVWDGVVKLWESLQPTFSFIKDTAIVVLEAWQRMFQKVAAVFVDKGGNIGKIISGIGEIFAAVWAVIEPLLEDMRVVWSEMMDWFAWAISDNIGYIVDLLFGVVEFLAGVFTGDWKRVWESIVTIFTAWTKQAVNTVEWMLSAFGLSFDKIKTAAVKCWNGIKEKTTSIWSGIKSTIKGAVNGVIGFINGMISGLISGINSAIQALNKLKVSVPDWVPGFGGKTFGFNIKTITAPQIPYLAKGAVIPPNAPFMAVLGDQKHGTNIEAPLSTIEEALDRVLDKRGGFGADNIEVQVVFSGDAAGLARYLTPHINKENKRIGGSLVKGAAY